MTAEIPARRMQDARWLMFVIAAIVIALDRATKLRVEAKIGLGHHVAVIQHYFWISHVLNTGAAFSMFDSSKSPLLVRNMLIGFSIVAVLVVIGVLWRVGRGISVTSIALALILGGALGNLYDRLRFGYVVDFLEVHIHGYHWPDFNVADSAIVCGACLLLIEMLLPQRNSD